MLKALEAGSTRFLRIVAMDRPAATKKSDILPGSTVRVKDLGKLMCNHDMQGSPAKAGAAFRIRRCTKPGCGRVEQEVFATKREH